MNAKTFKDPKEPKRFGLTRIKFKTWARVLLLAGLCLCVFLPQGAAAVLLINLLACLWLYYLRFKHLPEAKKARTLCLIDCQRKVKEPFVSVHLFLGPSVSKPKAFDLLKKREMIDYRNKELIVAVPLGREDLRKSLKAYAKRKQSAIKIILAPNLRAKSLNMALEASSDKSEFILKTEACSSPPPHLLRLAVEKMLGSGLDYLKFCLGNGDRKTLDLESELNLQTYCKGASSSRAAVLEEGGILAKRKALVAAGGWSEYEGACEEKTSLAMAKLGLKGAWSPNLLFIREEAPTFRSLSRHKRARIMRAARLLFESAPGDFFRLEKRKRIPVFLQLSCWMEFSLLPLLWFGIKGLDVFAGAAVIPYQAGTSALAGSTILLSLWLKLSWVHQKTEKTRRTKEIFKIYFAHLALSIESNLGWAALLPGLSGAGAEQARPRPRNKNESRKKLDDRLADDLSVMPRAALSCAAAALSCFLFVQSENVAMVTPLCAGALTTAGALFLRQELSVKKPR